MTIKETVVATIAMRAEELIAKGYPVIPSIGERTPQQHKLDAFFQDKPFGCYHAKSTELVEIMTGYKVQSPAKLKAEPFMILWDNSVNRCWMMLANEYGFADLQSARNHIEAGNERLATPQEARSFLDKFRQVDPEAFYEWCKSKLDATRWMLEL